MNILAYKLASPIVRGPYIDLPKWMRQLPNCPFTGSIERALWGGFHADRLGYAFVAGYGAALSRLFEYAGATTEATFGRSFPERPLPGPLSLCVTESGGAHPRAIASRLNKQGGALLLNGEKTFATLATVAEELLVVGSRGTLIGGRNRLRLVRVKPSAPGVTVEKRPDTPFAPEVPHAIVRFADVVVENEDLLPGDGYDVWLKPFRTIEDTHVLAATTGYLHGAARAYGFGHEIEAELTSLGLALIDVGARDPSAPLTHVVLAGLFATTRRLVTSLEPLWQKASAEESARWQRDLPLLMIADAVREKRTAAAWEHVSSSVRAPAPSLP